MEQQKKNVSSAIKKGGRTEILPFFTKKTVV